MKKLIIIGNGFDKAHDLKTNYNEFIEDLFTNKYFKDPDLYRDIIKSCSPSIKTFEKILEYMYAYYRSGSNYNAKIPFHYAGGQISDPKFDNRFIELLLIKIIEYRWCDVESRYFEELMLYNEHNKHPYSPKMLNDDFENVKKYLSNYLVDEEKRARKIDSYEYLFKLFADSPQTLILNFNYTRTIENLYKDVIKSSIMHIHGEIENPNNPIIFGYAANHDDSRKLLSHNNNEYIKNIKKHLYKRTNNENILKDFLGQNDKNYFDYEKIDILLFGHSCGLSDNLILNEIFNHKSIYSIKTFYYEKYENYFDVQVNIDRIMNDDTRFTNLIVNFKDSHRMPQWSDDTVQVQNFKKYIKDVKKQYPLKPFSLF